jgi:glucokinase
MKKEAVVGIDLGGTSTKVGLVSEIGEVIAMQRFDTEGRQDFSSFVDRLEAVYNKIITGNKGLAIKGVGIGSPNAN